MKTQGQKTFEALLAGHSVAGFHFSYEDLKAIKRDPRFVTLTDDQLHLMENLADPPVHKVVKKQTPRAKFIAEASVNMKRLAAYAWDAMQLASSHDPDHEKELEKLYRESIHSFNRTVDLQERVSRLEIQLDLIRRKS